MIAAWVCLLLIILTDASAQTIEKNSAKAISKRETQTTCDKGWFPFEDTCYRRGGTKEMRLTWVKASEHCKELGGSLVSLHSQAQSDFIRAFISMNSQETAWIGLNDRDNESEYKWDDGTTFDFKNWEPQEPSGPSLEKEDCVEFVFHSGRSNVGGKSGQWNDNDCDNTKEFICQKPGKAQGKKNRDPRFCTSSNGGWKHMSSCYFAVDKKKTWQEAEDYCIDTYKGHLATVNDFSVNLFIEYVFRNYTEDMWIGMKMKKGFQQQWSSEWFVAFTDWLNEPEDFMPDTCAARTLDKWAVLPCNRRLPFICETSTKTAPKMAFPVGMSCPENAGWRDIGGNYCYHVIPQHLKWFEANFRCLRIGGTLASFHSQIELDVLQPFIMANYIKSRFYSWIGLLRQKQNEEEFAWIDGSPYDLNRWSSSEPNSDKEECAELNPISLQWYDHFCDQGRPSICSVRKISTNKTTIITTIEDHTTSCTDGFSADVFISVTACTLFIAVILSIVVCYFFARSNRCIRRRTLHQRLDSSRQPRQQSEYEFGLAVKPQHLPQKAFDSKRKSDYEVAIEDEAYDYYESVR